MNNTRDTTSSPSVCLNVKPWYLESQILVRQFPFLILQVQFIVVFCLTSLLHRLFFKPCGLPLLVSQLTAGIILSPSLLITRYEFLKTFYELTFPEISNQIWQTMAALGLSLSLFIIGVKIDFTVIRKSGKIPFVVGLLMLIIPSIFNDLITLVYNRYRKSHLTLAQKTDLSTSATLLGITGFSVIAILLNDLNIIHSELGRLALSTSLVTETGALVLTIYSKTFLVHEQTTYHKYSNAIGIISLLALSTLIIRPLLKFIIRRTPKGRPVEACYLILAFFVALLGAMVTEISGEHIMLGCFIVGAAVPEGPPLGSAIIQKSEDFFVGMLMPFFITTSVMVTDFGKIGNGSDSEVIYGLIISTLTGFTAKILVCIACGWFYDWAVSDALALAAIMCSKGVISIIVCVTFQQTKMITESSFAYLMMVTIICAIVAPIAIKLLYHPLRKYSGYQKRNILHCSPDTPLRILACVHRSDNVSSIIKLFSFWGITAENRIVLNVLHLMKLVGRAQPIFICHDSQPQKASSVSRVNHSGDIICSFNTFYDAYRNNGLSMHFYTAVSPDKARHEDVCTLALDKMASLIILPFHRKLNVDGSSIDIDDHDKRALNYTILEQAPCSVGILIDRGSFRAPAALARLASNSVSRSLTGKEEKDKIVVGVIFIGGADDREAVAYAKRMGKDGKDKVKVMVIQIMALEESFCANILDSSIVAGIQEYSYTNPQFEFVLKVVKEGSETATIVKSFVHIFDLIVLGRRYGMDCTQTLGLKEWSEVPELGIIGDLLASPDLHCKTSVLIIQQQKQWTWRG